jgi:hypothetical protein
MDKNTDAVVLVDFSGLAWCRWEPAVSAHEAGEKAWAAHWPTCPQCSEEDGQAGACGYAPRRYDTKAVFRENIDLKFGTLSESIPAPVRTWIMVRDGKETRRRELLPTYKANREARPFDPRGLAEEYIRTKGCRFCWSPEAEADDTIATMATDLSAAGFNVIIVSADKDLWQLWDPPKVRIYLTTKKEFLTRDYLGKKFPDRSKTSKVPGLEDVKHVRLCKALWGDSSDNVPNVMPRMQADLVPLIKSSDGTLGDLLGRCSTVALGDKIMGKLQAALPQIETNYSVVGLYKDVPVVWLP